PAPPRGPRPPRNPAPAARDAISRTIGGAEHEPQPVTRLLGIDLGERRIGLGIADGDGSPGGPPGPIRPTRTDADDAAALGRIIAANDVAELVVGLPLEARGEHGPQAGLTSTWADA